MFILYGVSRYVGLAIVHPYFFGIWYMSSYIEKKFINQNKISLDQDTRGKACLANQDLYNSQQLIQELKKSLSDQGLLIV